MNFQEISTLNRRRFLAIAAASTASLKRSMSTEAEAEPRVGPVVVDTHVHCFAGEADSQFPYHPRSPYRPGAPATPQFLLKCMDEAGVDFAVIVHPEPYQDDHRYLEYCLDIGRGRLKGTCLVFADRPGSVEKLPQLVRRLPIVATRVHAYAPDRLPPFDSPELRNLWKTATELGIAVQIHFEPRFALGFERLIKEFPNTLVIIDHLGRPFQGSPDEHERVVKWARFDNTVIKLSSIPAQTSYPHRDPGPVIRRLEGEFGPERMIYGGGFSSTATGVTYRTARQRARSFIRHLPKADQEAILGGNAKRIFKFG